MKSGTRSPISVASLEIRSKCRTSSRNRGTSLVLFLICRDEEDQASRYESATVVALVLSMCVKRTGPWSVAASHPPSVVRGFLVTVQSSRGGAVGEHGHVGHEGNALW